jgi:hypothetical protein
MLISISPTSFADAPEDSLIWGVSYDWSNMDQDQLTLTGTNPIELYDDIQEAAQYAKFDIDILNIISGSSHFFIDQWDEESTTIIDADGDAIEVTKRTTDITLRHGSRIDSGLVSYWEDGDSENIDIWFQSTSSDLVILDINYVEYIDSDMKLVGGDLTMSGSMNHESVYQLVMSINGANDTIDGDINLGMMIGIEIPEISSTWRTKDSIPLYWMMNQDGVHESNICHGDECGMISGDYEIGVEYAFSLSGVPSEEAGLNADAFDISLSDSVTSQGSFFEQFDTEIYTGDNTPSCEGMSYTVNVDVGLDEDLEAQCRTVLPFFSPGLLGMSAISINSAISDGDSFNILYDELEYQLELILDSSDSNSSSNSGEESTFQCENGEEIPAHWENDGEEDCSDGSDENSITSDDDSEEMIVAISESDLFETMNIFTERLEYLVQDNQGQPLINLEDACLTTLWDPMESQILGIAVIHDEMIFVGPEIDGVSGHPVSISITYHVGEQARNARDSASNLNDLLSLAPPGDHDAREVRELLGISDDNSNFSVPSLSVISLIGIISLSAFNYRRDK